MLPPLTPYAVGVNDSEPAFKTISGVALLNPDAGPGVLPTKLAAAIDEPVFGMF
jgi:hypothetical protein